jgi:NAD dependent epimerase/dehydratase family enzyme
MMMHAMAEGSVHGAMNATSPNAVTNTVFTDILGRVLRRPTLVPLPGIGVEALLGEMGVELLLSGQRVLPDKALRSGYRFRFPHLEDSLRHQLGRPAGIRE